MSLSKTVQRIQDSVTMAVAAKAAAMQRDGADVISLAAGEPDFDTPRNIKDAAVRAIREGFTKYVAPGSGMIQLKEAVCTKFREDNGLEYGTGQIIVNSGVKHSLFLAVLALLDPGDEVIVPAPYWVTYKEQPRLVGAEPVIVPTRAENGLKLTAAELRRAITPRTRMLILCSPANPSGAVYSREELGRLAEVAVEHELHVLSDEIYEKLIYDGARHHSIAALGNEIKDLTIVTNGVSKAYAMTGWRIGYAGARKEIIAAMYKLQSQELTHPSSISQRAAIEALTGPQDFLPEMVSAFDSRRRFMVERLNAMPGVKCSMPQGTFYAFPDVSGTYGRAAGPWRIADSVGLCEYLLHRAKVACVPGAGFGTGEHLRLSYATAMEDIEKAMDRMAEALAELA